MATSKKTAKKSSAKNTARIATDAADAVRTRTNRPYPASSFADALVLGNAVMMHAAGERVRRLTLLEKMAKSANSSSTKMMITNSGKYGVTVGSYAADFIELTEKGAVAVNTSLHPRDRRKAEFDLAIDGIAPFKLLYEHYKGKRLPEREIVKDFLRDSGQAVSDLDECVDTFIVNVKDLGLLRTIGGAETLLSIEHVLEEFPGSDGNGSIQRVPISQPAPAIVKRIAEDTSTAADWEKICFYITPIGVRR